MILMSIEDIDKRIKVLEHDLSHASENLTRAEQQVDNLKKTVFSMKGGLIELQNVRNLLSQSIEEHVDHEKDINVVD